MFFFFRSKQTNTPHLDLSLTGTVKLYFSFSFLLSFFIFQLTICFYLLCVFFFSIFSLWLCICSLGKTYHFFSIYSSPVLATSEEFENGGFTLKTHQMFSIHTTPDKVDWTQQSANILDLCLRKSRSGKSRDYRDVNIYKKRRFQNVFRPN